MTIAFIHTDLRIYWPARLNALNKSFEQKGWKLHIIEIAGKGSPYSFADKERPYPELDWRILFPEDSPETLNSAVIKRALHQELDKLNPDIIIAGAIAFPSGANAVSWTLKNHKKMICFDDTKVEINQRSGLVNYIKEAVYNGVDAMLYPAPEWKLTGERWGFEISRQFYGIDVVDNDFWNPDNNNSSVDNTKLADNSFFLFTGRLLGLKNVSTLLKAYKNYIKNNPNPKDLIIVGEGPEKENLINLANSLEINSHVRFLPFMNQSELKELYQKCTALILPSEEETWGLVINEALASGAPVIASNKCGATSSLIRNDINGYSFDPFDAEILSTLLNKISILEKSERLRMKTECKNLISEWGLPKFCNGCVSAISFLENNAKRKVKLTDKIIINLWKGRYRPK